MINYKPQPIDTSLVELTQDLLPLIELLAENAHDCWAAQRMAEGWTWGLERCDVKKQHPDLVPYHQLSESEKEYDRVTAIETIRAMIALGFTVQKAQQRHSAEQAAAAADA